MPIKRMHAYKLGSLTVATICSAAISLLCSILIARTLSLSEFGIYSVIMATTLIVPQFIDFGINQILAQRIAVRPTTVLFAEIVTLRTIIGMLCSLLLLGLLMFLKTTTERAWIYALLAVPWMLIISTIQAHLQGLRKTKSMVALIIIPALLRLLSTSLVLQLFPTLAMMALASTLPVLLTGLVLLIIYRSKYLTGMRFRLTNHIIPVIALAGLSVCLVTILTRTGLWLVANLSGAESAGRYAVAMQGASILFMIGSSVSVYFTPEIAIMDKAGNLAKFFRSYFRFCLKSISLLIPAAYVCAYVIPLAFGPRFAQIEGITFILGIAFIISLLNGPFYIFQQSRHNYAIIAGVHICQIGILGIFSYLCVPFWGMYAVAFGEILIRITAFALYITLGITMTRKQGSV